MSTKIISGSNLGLATQISSTLQIPLTPRKITHFRNGEICVSIQESVRNHDVFIVQTKGPSQSTNDMLMELLILIDACRRSAAKSIYVVLPCYPYARQDKKEESREPITAKLVANLLAAAGMTRLIVMDLHAAQIQGFFDLPVDNIYSVGLVRDYLQSYVFPTALTSLTTSSTPMTPTTPTTPPTTPSTTQLSSPKPQSPVAKKFVLVSPDAGATKRTLKFGKILSLPTIIMHKQRDYSRPNTVEQITIIGDASQYQGKTAIILDDMIDTAGTLVAAVDSLHSNGIQNVICVVTHGILSHPALERINNCPALTNVIVSDSLDQTKNLELCPKLRVFPIGPLLGRAIDSIINNYSMASLFT